MSRVESFVADARQVLELLGVVAVRVIVKGDPAQQVGNVEHAWQQLRSRIEREEGTIRSEAALVDLGPRGRALPDRALDARADQNTEKAVRHADALSPGE
jgi:site-specific recombinase XerC